MVKQSSWTASVSSVSSFKMSGTNHPETQHHIPEKWSSLTQLFSPHPVQILAMTPYSQKTAFIAIFTTAMKLPYQLALQYVP
jgi:hypothetical protein